jgi:hypothetical protein
MIKNKPFFGFSIILILSLLSGVFVSTVHADIVTYFYAPIATPNPSALGQKITIMSTIIPAPPAGESYHGIQLSLIDINGNYRVLGTNNTEPETGKITFSWVPDLYGPYHFTLTYSGETIAGNVYSACENSFYFDPPALHSPAPTQILRPEFTANPSSIPPISYPTETPNPSIFDVSTESQKLVRNLPVYIISLIVVADMVVLGILLRRRFKKARREDK